MAPPPQLSFHCQEKLSVSIDQYHFIIAVAKTPTFFNYLHSVMLRHFNVSVILVSMMLIKLYWVCSCIKNLLHQLGNYFVVLLSHCDASSCLIRHFLEDALQTFTQTALWALLHAHWAALNRPDPQKMHYRDCDVLPSVAAFFALRFIPQAIFNHFFMSNQSI